LALRGVDGVQPAGTYEIETDEEFLEGLSFPVWHRVATSLVLPLPGKSASYEMIRINPADLEAAERRDADTG
jgi:hypothetical protein